LPTRPGSRICQRHALRILPAIGPHRRGPWTDARRRE